MTIERPYWIEVQYAVTCDRCPERLVAIADTPEDGQRIAREHWQWHDQEQP